MKNAKEESLLDGLMKGIGRRLGKRRREVHEAIEEFNRELNGPQDDVTADSPEPENLSSSPDEEADRDQG